MNLPNILSIFLLGVAIGCSLCTTWNSRPYRKTKTYRNGQLVEEKIVPRRKELDDALHDMATQKIEELKQERDSAKQEAEDLRNALYEEQMSWRNNVHELPLDEQLEFVRKIAANIGYMVLPEPQHPDSPNRDSEGVHVSYLPSEKLWYVDLARRNAISKRVSRQRMALKENEYAELADAVWVAH